METMLSPPDGEHYISTQRKLVGQQARLETSFDTYLASVPDKKLLAQINDHLGHLEKHFRGCQGLIASAEEHKGRSQDPLIRDQCAKVLTRNKDVIQTARQRLLTWFPEILDSQQAPPQNIAS